MTNLSEAVKLLENSGVLANLAADAQAEREVERLALVEKLRTAEAAEHERCEKIQQKRDEIQKRIDRDEASLKLARAELQQLEAPGAYFTIENLKGKLRKLADPAYAKAIIECGKLWDKARNTGRSSRGVARTLNGRREIADSNYLEVGDVMTTIREAERVIEAMQEQPRPDDLDQVLEAMLTPLRQSVRSLGGYA